MGKALQSKLFPNAYLRIDGTGVSAPSSGGGGTVNCQSGVAGFETVEEELQPDGTIAFASAAFPNVYLRMDGSGVKSANDSGAGAVNCAFGVGAWEKFHKRSQGDGTVAFESAAFPGVVLRMDGTGIGKFGLPSGGGTVNCQFCADPSNVGPWEKFLLHDPPFPSVNSPDEAGTGTSTGTSAAAAATGNQIVDDGSPVSRAQFESNLNQGNYSYEIKEFTRQERLAVGGWNGANFPVLRWARTGQNDQRFVLLPEVGGGKFRLQTLQPDVKERLFVGITDSGAAITWPRSDDDSQLFQIEWQSDGKFALREGTKGEFLDVSFGGDAVRWTGVDDKNDRPKPNQVFELYAPQRYAAYVPSRWMKQIGNDRLLSQLSIPGAHDAAARSGLGAVCQNWTISQQLEAGVRCFDIRCCRVGTANNATFSIHHGEIFQGLYFREVLDDCLAFLNQNPSECIVMMIQQEGTPASSDLPSFGQIFRVNYWEHYKDRWYTAGTLPSLGQVRGKIVLLSNFGRFSDQSPMAWWGGSGFVVENSYEVWADNIPGKLGVTGKWNLVKANLELAAKNAAANPPRWYITFASGATGLLPETVAGSINPQLESFFADNALRHYGTVMMDFVPEMVIRQIIETN